MEPSIGGARLRNTYGSVFAHGGLEVVAAFEAVMREVVADGSNDFVFAHVPLPHPPLVLGPECDVVPERASDQREYGYHPTEDRASWRLALGEQLSCTELLIERLAETVDESTAIVMTSDHGTESMGQMIKPAESWSDNDLAERLSAFTTDRFPQICKKPDGDVNVVYVRGLLECALAVELDLDSPLFHLMTHSRDADVLPVSRVSDARMASIRDGYQVSSTRETVHASG